MNFLTREMHPSVVRGHSRVKHMGRYGAGRVTELKTNRAAQNKVGRVRRASPKSC